MKNLDTFIAYLLIILTSGIFWTINYFLIENSIFGRFFLFVMLFIYTAKFVTMLEF